MEGWEGGWTGKLGVEARVSAAADQRWALHFASRRQAGAVKGWRWHLPRPNGRPSAALVTEVPISKRPFHFFSAIQRRRLT